MKNKIIQFAVGIVSLIVFALALASCEVIAAGTEAAHNTETVWLHLIPGVPFKGEDGVLTAELALDFSRAIDGLETGMSEEALKALIKIEFEDAEVGAEAMRAIQVEKFAESFYRLTVINVPGAVGVAKITVNRPNITPSFRLWSFDGQIIPDEEGPAMQSFSFAAGGVNSGLSAPASGFIDQENRTVAVTLPEGSTPVNLTPTVATTEGSSYTPHGALDWTESQTFTVSSDTDPSKKKEYTVTVTVQTSSTAAITGFQFRKAENPTLSVDSVSGEINEAEHTITVTAPYGTKRSALVPLIAHTGASIAPDNDSTARDFSSPFTYTVTATDGTTHVAYLVTVNLAASPQYSDNIAELATLSAYYVSLNGAGARDGTNWNHAVNRCKLYEVLLKAQDVATAQAPVSVYVAAGTYIAWSTGNNDAPTDRALSTFTLGSNVKVYGGFANGLSGTVSETDMSDRAARFSTDDIGAGGSLGYGTIKADYADYETILSGDLDVDDVYDSDTGFLTENYEGNAMHVVTGGGAAADAATVLDGFTIKGAYADSGYAWTTDNDKGGGIYNEESSSPTLNNLTITGNRAHGVGGGIYNHFSSPTMSNMTIMGNQASNGGGGISNHFSSPTMSNMTIMGNQTIDDKGCTGCGGGGILNGFYSTAILTNVTIVGNHAFGDGGGMKNADEAIAILTNVRIVGNTSDGIGNYNGGGGIYNYGYANLFLTNVIITGNKAIGKGGGIYNYNQSRATLTNVTIAGNHAAKGGGLYSYSATTANIRNSIVWGNTSDSGVQVINDNSYYAVSTTWTYSLVQGSGGGSWNSSFGTDDGNNIDSDPVFVTSVAASSAPTSAGNYRLQAGSSALDKGSDSLYDQAAPDGWEANTGLSWSTTLSKDLAGATRIKGGHIDIGAYEKQ
ncbi:MAG: DUF5018 domain-containing protein [Spirochaetaceae bacterium]|jgi:hypothetical protein|nr:DUF5018 domain-containing protein [Spirochaetaceae bacterium]